MIPALLLFLTLPANAALVAADNAIVNTITAQAPSNGIFFSSALSITNGSSLTLQGAGGYVSAVSSINASAFFGDASQLHGVGRLISSQTLSGANAFNSSFTVRSGGREIILSTSTSTNSVSIGPEGVLRFYPAIHNSSRTIGIPQYFTSNTTLGPCVPGSTITITTTGGQIQINFAGSVTSASATATVLQDGQFINGLSATKGVNSYLSANPETATFFPASFSYLLDAPSAGAHTYCLSLAALGSSGATFEEGVMTNIFYVIEVK